MKICWDNLEKLKYNKRTKVLYGRKYKEPYIYMDSCKNCNESYLSQKYNISDYCSNSCSQIGKTNPMWKHGYDNSYIYKSWQSMKQRCLNIKNHKYPIYGGRGIKICDRWLNSFENFLEDMGDRPKGRTLDRIDNNGNYEPENCRWSTLTQQNRNRSISKLDEEKIKQIKVLFKENKLTQKEIGKIFGVNRATISLIKNKKRWN